MIPEFAGVITRTRCASEAGVPAHLIGKVSVDHLSGTSCVGAARVDNRVELLRALDLEVGLWGDVRPTDERHDDLHLIHKAYLRWGPASVKRVLGDWAFAVWDPQRLRLFLARDHFGITSLYYAIKGDKFGFATDQRALLDLGLARSELNSLYLGRLLVNSVAYHGFDTVYEDVHRLPPAHTLTIDPETLRVDRYWDLGSVEPLVLRDRNEYVDGLVEVFDKAVQARLRRDQGGLLGSTLSGGLDSSSVTATAARYLPGEVVQAFTSVPVYDSDPFAGHYFSNEWPYAHATALHAGNVEHHAVDAAGMTPVAGIRAQLGALGEPAASAGNAYWMVAMFNAAAARGCSVLLTGQFGNAGLSLRGGIASQGLGYQWRKLGARSWLKGVAKRRLPISVVRAIRARRAGREPYAGTAINLEFADHLNLLQRELDDNPRSIMSERDWVLPGRSSVGAVHARSARAAGIDMRDPTADIRVLNFAWSVPDHVFREPSTDTDRWLVRQAMRTRLPDEVRLNPRIGRQSADLPIRFRRSAQEVADALDQIESSTAASAIVSLPRMRRAWHGVVQRNDPGAFMMAATTLSRGLMVGLFVAESDGLVR